MYYIQSVEYFDKKTDAEEVFDCLARQDGYKGGRILSPSVIRPAWMVQTFYEDNPEAKWLPDGCMRTFVPASIRKSLGIQA